MEKQKTISGAELALLSLLAEKPMHAYEIEQVIEERGMREWTSIGFSSIYYLLNKMHTSGWLKREELQSDAGGPNKQVFYLSDAGKNIWRESVIDVLSLPHPGENPFLIGLSILPLLEKKEIQDGFQMHLIQLQKTAESLRKKLANYGKHIPRHVVAMFDYSQKQINASITWIEEWLPVLSEKTR